ncbi:pentapeptide repeat-containing protein [Streptomyces hainanensis]|uniref:pentapeptide repeat-containing protein n=1 Tax=Streptomyces hainanensis TaxID=402648 RepID=UPI001FB7F813|nr:pentapeptide repeat-containing protein [Streptomyces hainanensis]
MSEESTAVIGRAALRADCGSCFGLCCVALPFTASADFAVSKPAGTPCGNLDADFRCGIHAGLRERGFTGCTVFDCFGAGQRVSRETFGGRDWRAAPATAASMFAAFGVVRQLHELLWYLGESLAGPAARELGRELRATSGRIEALAGGDPVELAAVDVPALRAEVGELLGRVSESVRAARVPGRRRDRRGADLAGARLHGADLRGASLRGALLIAAELGGADLRSADLLGADLRNANLAGADLRDALFLTQAQLNAARGDGRTRLPAGLDRPAHWAGPPA